MARVERATAGAFRSGEVVASGRTWARRCAVFACTAGVLVSSGCTDLFGFEEAWNVVDCVSDRDCEDSPSGEESVCSAQGKCTKLTQGTEDGGQCAHPCTAFNECLDDLCAPGSKLPPYGEGDNTVDVPTNAGAVCYQYSAHECEHLTGVGFVLSSATTASVRFAVYSDVGGVPTKRLTQTVETPIDGTSSDIILNPAAPIGCNPPSVDTAYWICFVSSSFSLPFNAIMESQSKFINLDASPQQIDRWLRSGLPLNWSQSDASSSWTPILYNWVTIPAQ